MRIPPGLAILALGLLVLSVVVPAAPADVPPARTASEPIATNSESNFSLNGIGPGVDAPAGSVLAIQYELLDPAFSTAQTGLFVHVPSPQVSYNVSWGVLRSFLPGSTVQFNGTGWTSPANFSFNVLLSNETVFSNTGVASKDRATLSTQGVALTSAEPYGSLSVQLRWRWILAPSAGANQTGAWIPSSTGATIAPGQYAQLASGSSVMATVGTNFSACLTGAVGGRTFQAQALIPDPHLLIDATTGSPAPDAGGSTFCLALTIPGWLVPQQIEVELWNLVAPANDSGNVTTLLLYIVKVQVTAPSAPTPSAYGVPLSTWYLAGTGAAGIVGVVAVAAVYRGRSGPPSGPGPAARPADSRPPPGGAL